MKWFLVAVGALHTLFMLAELFPWSFPTLLQKVSARLPAGEQWTDRQQRLVATVVHNAGIYNGVLAGGLFWAAWFGDPARDLARVLLVGVVIVGVFGTVTLRSWPTAIQALLGIAGVALLR